MEYPGNGKYALLEETKRKGQSAEGKPIWKFNMLSHAKLKALDRTQAAKTKKFVIVDMDTHEEIARFENGCELKKAEA